MGDAYHAINLHLIFSCKDRMGLITPAIATELYPYIAGVLENKDAVLLEGGGVADHCHLLVGLPPKYAPADCIRDIKANSSRWIHEKWPKHPFAWQSGYSVFSVSISKVQATKEYIRKQEEHHRTISFREELEWFLKNHGVEYDPRFLPPGPSMPPPPEAPDAGNPVPGADAPG